MRALILIAAAGLALSGCSALGTGIPSSPSAVCDKSTLDETGGQLVELGYRLFRTAGELAVDSGKLKGAAATRVRVLDNQLFAATQAVQSAYATCNASSYAAAIEQAKALLANANAALPK